jgi:tRNA dimethylallyltransferase
MNMGSSGKPPVALIAGPTASGKSALALALAERTGGIVINADSAQAYKDLRIVSARPSRDDEARAPHRLYGYRDGADVCSAADWAEDAKREIAAAHEAGRLPVLVGGTGLYLRTLIDGIAPVPEIDPGVRAAVRALTVAEAHDALRNEDPEAAGRIRPSDTTRTARALEVVRATGRTLKSWQAEKVGGIGDAIALRPLVLLPPRDWLHERCDARFLEIFSNEGVEEVRLLLKRNLPKLAPVMRAIGVPEIAAFLHDDLNREEAIAAGQAATRQYAKRQYTWFRHQPPATWLRFEGRPDSPSVRAELVEALSFS